MIKVENIEVFNFEGALRGMRAKGYKKNKNGKYETFASRNGKSVNLGTYKTETEAKEVVFNHRKKVFIDGVSKFECNINDGKVYEKKYVVYPSGNIYNLYGEKIIGCIDRCGYRHSVFGGKNVNFHRIIAELFIPNVNHKPCVNHIDGDKLNNRADNLEWCTHSENTIHAYITGLETKRFGEKHHAHKLSENDVIYIRNNYKKRDKIFGAIPLGKMFNVDRTTILDVIKRKTWRHLA